MINCKLTFKEAQGEDKNVDTSIYTDVLRLDYNSYEPSYADEIINGVHDILNTTILYRDDLNKNSDYIIDLEVILEVTKNLKKIYHNTYEIGINNTVVDNKILALTIAEDLVDLLYNEL